MCCQSVNHITGLCSEFQNLLKELPEKQRFLAEHQSQLEKRIQDIHHRIELSDKFSSKDALFVGLELREVLRNRRITKNEIYILSAIKKQVTGREGLIRELGNIVRIAPSQVARKYRKRVKQEDSNGKRA